MSTTTDPLIAWQRLRAGNERLFVPVRGHRGGLIDEAPVAAVFRCADAGVASEVILGQSWGSLVEVSTWGHTVDTGVIATLEYAVEVLEVPGHTAHHVAFYLPPQGEAGAELFCGDTLFAGGCGRLFEGTPEQMHASLQRLAALPASTRVWCAHEYTEGNLRWAAAEAPGDGPIAGRLAAVRAQRAAGQPTIPSSIGLERATNLFMRAADGAELRRRRGSKDLWRG